MPEGIAHWDEVESEVWALPPMGATWTALGEAAGTRAVGLYRVQIPAGVQSTPAHSHGVEEEIFFVLGGNGTLWLEGGDGVALGAGDAIVHVAAGPAHSGSQAHPQPAR